MEDILASIKRIIADDSQAAVAAVSHVEEMGSAGRNGGAAFHAFDRIAAQDDEGAEEVLELTQPIEPATAAAPLHPQEIDARTPAQEQPAAAQPEPVRVTPRQPAARPRSSTASAAPSAAIVSDDAAIASRQSLAALSALIVTPEDDAAPNTLDGLVREMLRPMLKDWLDQRLPELVEQLVEKEIARITGRLS